MGQILKKLVEEKGEACTMDGKRQSKPFSPNWKPWCVMDSKHNKCVPIVGWLWCGAQGVNKKIQSHPTRLNWWGRHQRWMRSKKHVSND
jgi:hypothetical protein